VKQLLEICISNLPFLLTKLSQQKQHSSKLQQITCY